MNEETSSFSFSSSLSPAVFPHRPHLSPSPLPPPVLYVPPPPPHHPPYPLPTCASGATSWTFLYPLEVVRSRVTCGNVPPWLVEGGVNPIRIMRHIVATEGGRALYRGLGALMCEGMRRNVDRDVICVSL